MGDCWESIISVNKNNNLGTTFIKINGQKVSLLGNTVQDCTTLIYIQKYYPATIGFTSNSSSTAASSTFYTIVRDPCSPEIAMIHGSAFGTENLVLTNALFKESLHVWNPGSSIGPISSVILNNMGIGILGASHFTFVFVNGTRITTANPAGGLQRVSSTVMCNRKFWTLDKVIVLWDSGVSTLANTSIYISQDYGSSFRAFGVAVGGGGYISDIYIQDIYSHILVLIKDASGADIITSINLDFSSTTKYTSAGASIINAGVKGSSPKIVGVKTGEIYLTGDNLNYSPDSGSSIYPMTLTSRYYVNSTLGTLEYIKDMAVSVNNYYLAVLTSLNRVFVGQVGSTNFYEIVGGILPADEATILFDSRSNLHVITPPDNIRTFALQNEIASLGLACTYNSLNLNLSSFYEIDMGDTCNLLAGCPANRRLVYYNPTPYVNPPSPTPRYHIDRYASDYESNFAIITNNSTDGLILTDGPCADQNFTVSAGTWFDYSTGSTGTYDKIVSTNCSIHGSITQKYYGSPFRPYFAIYENNKLIRKVNADIGIQEINGRNTYQFNMTGYNAGCVDTPLNFKGGANLNYWNCYGGYNTFGTGSLWSEYQVVNSTNYNSITWTSNIDGIYIFKAAVLDPNYSYCTLETEFAIQVIGAPTGTITQISVLLLVNACAISLLVISYLVYSRKQKATLRFNLEKKKRE
ncbi:hypothetical protein HDV01_001704 [Terramyces sp. JEL0728]|nr:hypothetical protein HDV01_001704 [Terramyces sp. JEL0728]